MATAPHPRTEVISPPINGLPKTYRSTRVAAPEASLPAPGTVLGNRYGSAYANHIVFDSNKIPSDGKTLEVIVHFEPLPGPLMYGTRKIREINACVAYTEQVVAASTVATSDPNVTYEPINDFLSLKRTETPPTAAMNAFYRSFPSSANFDLPPVLVSVEAVWHEESGNGESEAEWKGLAVGESRSLSGNEANNVQSSAGLMPEINPVIRRVASDRVPTTNHFFLLPIPVTTSAILSKCGASAIWPVFKPEAVSFTLKGTKVSVQAGASASAAFGTGDNGITGSVDLTKGNSKSYDYSPAVNVVNIPPTIHAALTVSNATHANVDITASASASWTGDKGTTLENSTTPPAWSTVAGMPSVTSTSQATASASGGITPSSISATTPAAIPTSGVYLFDSRIEEFDFGYAMVFAETVNASVFA